MQYSLKPKILQIVGDSKFGGASFVVADIAQMLQKQGCDVTVLATDPQMEELLGARGIKIWKFRGIQRSVNPFKDIFVCLRLSSEMKHRFDIVHTHTSKGGAIGRIAAKMAGIPVVIHTVHGYAFHEFSNNMVAKFFMLIEKVLAKITDKLIYVNEYDRDNAIQKKLVRSDQAVTVYNGIPKERVLLAKTTDKAGYLKELSLDTSAFLSVFVGRIAKQKGVKYLLEAVSRVTKEKAGANFHQIFVGDGELKSNCEAYAKSLGIESHVHFLGFREDAVNWTACADLFVLSSLWEGHSITLLEAMGCGCPIVATDIKGNRETIVHKYNGILVEPADAKALARAIISILNDTSFARQLGENAMKTFMENYTLDKMLTKTWWVYENVMNKKLSFGSL